MDGSWLCCTSGQAEESYNGQQRGLTEIEKAVVPRIKVPSIPLKELKKITAKFGSNAQIGEGSFGSVYFAQLNDGKEVAVKKIHVSMASRLKHDNVVELLGYCVDGDLRVLAYEYATMGSLHNILHGREGAQSGMTLDWMHRLRIAIDAARGLEYLHDKVQPSIIHRDISSSNVLVFEDCKAKIADFNLSYEPPHPDHCVQFKDNLDYCAPEYRMGRMTKKSDVYSFGVVLLELLTGRKPRDQTIPHEEHNLVAWAKEILPSLQSLSDNNEVGQFIDPNLKYYHPKGVAKLARVAVMCVLDRQSSRPKMRDVVKGLERILRMS